MSTIINKCKVTKASSSVYLCTLEYLSNVRCANDFDHDCNPLFKAYVANLQANADSAPSHAPGPGLLGAGPGYPGLPAYHQLAAAQRLASIHRTLLTSASSEAGESQVTWDSVERGG